MTKPITPDMLPEVAIDPAKEVRSYHCTTDEIICAFLNAAIESGEAQMLTDAVPGQF